MTEYTRLVDGKAHRITDYGYTDFHGHMVKTACGEHIYERQENVDVYMTDEEPDLDEYCTNCDHSSGSAEFPEDLKA